MEISIDHPSQRKPGAILRIMEERLKVTERSSELLLPSHIQRTRMRRKELSSCKEGNHGPMVDSGPCYLAQAHVKGRLHLLGLHTPQPLQCTTRHPGAVQTTPEGAGSNLPRCPCSVVSSGTKKTQDWRTQAFYLGSQRTGNRGQHPQPGRTAFGEGTST